jgi:hypothetical protein
LINSFSNLLFGVDGNNPNVIREFAYHNDPFVPRNNTANSNTYSTSASSTSNLATSGNLNLKVEAEKAANDQNNAIQNRRGWQIIAAQIINQWSHPSLYPSLLLLSSSSSGDHVASFILTHIGLI